MIFIHGAYINDEIWERQTPYFDAAGFQVINVVLPSHGSAKPLNVLEYRVDDFADEVLQLLDHLHIRRGVFIGLSLGSMIAQNFAARFPERTGGIILIGNVASMRLTLLEKTVTAIFFPKWLASMLFSRLTTKQFLKLSFMMTWFMRGNRWLGNKDTRQKIRDMIGQMKREEIRRIFGAVHGFRKQNLFSGTYPILLLNGEFDSPVIHYHARHFLKLYPKRAQFIKLKACGHACNYDDPTAFNETVHRWLEEIRWIVGTNLGVSGKDYTSEYSKSLGNRLSN